MQTLIKNVTIINPNDELKDNQNILIEGKYIKEISSSKIHTKENVKVIDGDNNYVLPGFIDCHTHIGFPKGRCDGVSEVLKKTREVKRAGADFIKVMCSGGVLTTNTSHEFSQFNLEELKTIVGEAKTTNSNVSAHCHSLEGINKCIDAGFSSIEHGTFIDEKTSKRMVENNVTLVPTLLVHQFLYEHGFPVWDIYADEKFDKLKEVVKVHKENIKVAYDEGVNIVMGTDSGVIPHGHNLNELLYLIDIGMTPMEAIESATIKAAEFIGKDDVGSIGIGKCADIIFIEDNPLDDMAILTKPNNIMRVFQDGAEVKNRYGLM